jgi:hypothetical protein
MQNQNFNFLGFSFCFGIYFYKNSVFMNYNFKNKYTGDKYFTQILEYIILKIKQIYEVW